MSKEQQETEAIKSALVQVKQYATQLSKISDVCVLKTMADKAEALEIWAKRAKIGYDTARQAAEIRTRAARRGGEILAMLDKGYKGKDQKSQYQEQCEKANIPGWKAAIWKRLADVPDHAFEEEMSTNMMPSIRKMVRGNIDKKKEGCSLFIRLNNDETAALDSVRARYKKKPEGASRETIARHLLVETLNKMYKPQK